MLAEERKTILIVEDEEHLADALSHNLQFEGYSTTQAEDGEEGLKLAQNIQFDLIILDVMMPGMDGFETCRRLKAEPNTQDVPVIFVTAKAETDSIVNGFETGGVDYVVKPFQAEEVLARVRTHLRIVRLAREVERTCTVLRTHVEGSRG